MKQLIPLVACVLLAQAQQDIRIDNYDQSGKRSGYTIIKPNGRVDMYDAQSRRQGYGVITSGSDGSSRIDTYSTTSERTGAYGTTTRGKR